MLAQFPSPPDAVEALRRFRAATGPDTNLTWAFRAEHARRNHGGFVDRGQRSLFR